MTDAELAAIQERAAKAAPAPWHGMYACGDTITGVRLNRGSSIGLGETEFTMDDIRFITHAREDIPALLAEIGRLKAIIGQTQTIKDVDIASNIDQ